MSTTMDELPQLRVRQPSLMDRVMGEKEVRKESHLTQPKEFTSYQGIVSGSINKQLNENYEGKMFKQLTALEQREVALNAVKSLRNHLGEGFSTMEEDRNCKVSVQWSVKSDWISGGYTVASTYNVCQQLFDLSLIFHNIKYWMYIDSDGNLKSYDMKYEQLESDPLVAEVEMEEEKINSLLSTFGENEMKARITNYTLEKEPNGKQYVLYHIECKLESSSDDINWVVTKRYSDCLAFHERITSTIVVQTYKIDFPPKLYTGNKNVMKINKRLKDLQRWFSQIISQHSVVFANYESLVHQFLETETNIASFISSKYKVDLDQVKKLLEEASNALHALPNYEHVIATVIDEKVKQVKEQACTDDEIAKMALERNQYDVQLTLQRLTQPDADE